MHLNSKGYGSRACSRDEHGCRKDLALIRWPPFVPILGAAGGVWVRSALFGYRALVAGESTSHVIRRSLLPRPSESVFGSCSKLPGLI